MCTQKFQKVAGCDKVFVKLTALSYTSCLKPAAFVKDYFIDSWINNSKLCLKIMLSFVLVQQAAACKNRSTLIVLGFNGRRAAIKVSYDHSHL